MTQITAHILPDTPEFAANQNQMTSIIDDLQRVVNETIKGGDEKSRNRHTDRGKLLVRDRINNLLDKGSAFLEIGQLAAHNVYDDAVPSAGVVAGIGTISGV